MPCLECRVLTQPHYGAVDADDDDVRVRGGNGESRGARAAATVYSRDD